MMDVKMTIELLATSLAQTHLAKLLILVIRPTLARGEKVPNFYHFTFY